MSTAIEIDLIIERAITAGLKAREDAGAGWCDAGMIGFITSIVGNDYNQLVRDEYYKRQTRRYRVVWEFEICGEEPNYTSFSEDEVVDAVRNAFSLDDQEVIVVGRECDEVQSS